MKNNTGTVEEIESEIQRNKDIISNTKISVKEEKDIVNKISQLE
jgi:hypothetical protein